MKKLITLTMLLLFAIVGVNAQTYKITFNGSNAGDTDFFKWNSSKHNFNTKFNSCTYDGVEYTSGLKMEGATEVSWTSFAASTVRIVQSTWSDKTIKLDGTELAVADADDMSTDGCRIYTITDVEAGDHSVTRGSGESGIFTIIVAYSGSVKPRLSTPVISFNATSGEVTIAAVENASKVTYTTDGNDPTAESTEYTAPFTVEDGTTVKAIAIYDGENYINSEIATQKVTLEGVVVATPVITAINGTMMITCETNGATIKYSTDGENYANYTQPVTFFANTTVYAKAVREGATDSEVATKNVEAAPAAAAGSYTKILGFVKPGSSNWEYMNDDSKDYGIKGITGTDEEGWSLWISPNSSGTYDKGISGDGSANSTYTINETAYQYIKNSNGRQFNIGVPSGYKVNRLTIYSFNNGSPSTTSLWSNVAGTTYTAETEIPLVANAGNQPEIRVFSLDDVTDNITLTNNGAVQQCFILVVDYKTSVCSTPTITVGDFSFEHRGYPVTITCKEGETLNVAINGDGTDFVERTSPFLIYETGTSVFYAKATAEGKEESDVVQREVSNGNTNEKLIAWVYTNGYGTGNYDFETDPMAFELRLSNDYSVVDVNYDANTEPAEDLKFADLIVCSEAMAGGKTMSNGMKKFVGVTPMISLKTFNYGAGRWDWGSAKNPSAGTVYFKPKSSLYKLFDGVASDGYGIQLASPFEGNVIQTVDFSEEVLENMNILGTLDDDDTQAVMYASKDSKFFGLGLSSDCRNQYTDNAKNIVKNAVAMMLAGEDLTTKVNSITKTITNVGYATLCSEYPLDFTESDVTAYIATVDNEHNVSFTQVNGVPACTGVLLKGTPGEKTISTVESSIYGVGDNKFIGTVFDYPLTPEAGFVLMASPEVGFYKNNNLFTVGAHTAYLPAPVVAEGRTFIGLFEDEDETTGIVSVGHDSSRQNALYNLNGQRIEKAQKGLFIIGGKKVIK